MFIRLLSLAICFMVLKVPDKYTGHTHPWQYFSNSHLYAPPMSVNVQYKIIAIISAIDVFAYSLNYGNYTYRPIKAITDVELKLCTS